MRQKVIIAILLAIFITGCAINGNTTGAPQTSSLPDITSNIPNPTASTPVAASSNVAAPASPIQPLTSTGADNPAVYDNDLCTSNEDVLFSFKVVDSQKTLSVCVAKNDDYIVYRFGTKDNVELEYPANRGDSWINFTYSYYLRGGGAENAGLDLYYLSFENSGYAYEIYQEYDAASNLTNVGVKVTVISTGNVTDIKGQSDSVKGSLLSLRGNTKVNQVQDSSLPSASDSQNGEFERNQYITYMEKLNPKIESMDELFYKEKDVDNDGYVEIIAAFGDKSNVSDGTDWIESSFILRDKNGKIELISQDYCIGGYESYSMQLVQFTGSSETYIAVGVTNTASLYGVYIYAVSGDDVKQIGGAASPTGAGNAYLSNKQSDGTYGGYTSEQYSYDVLYYPITTFYKFNDGAFDQQNSAVDVGDYPATPTDVVIQYLSLSCLEASFYSSDMEQRLYDIAGYQYWDIYGSPGEWNMALFNYDMGFDQPDEPSMTLVETDSGQESTITVTLSNQISEETATVTFDLALQDSKWHISSVDETISIGSGDNNITISSYPVQTQQYNDNGGYVDFDFSLLKLNGNYGGISKINDFFSGRPQFFHDDYPSDYLQIARNGMSDGYYRSAHYYYSAKIGSIISTWADLNGGAGGVSWVGIEGDVFDLNTGKKLGLPDIFRVSEDVYLKRIYDIVSQQIEAKIKDAGGNSDFFFDDAYSTDGQKSIQAFDVNDFYLTDNSLIVFYQKYALAIGAAGPQVFIIPFSSIKDILANDVKF